MVEVLAIKAQELVIANKDLQGLLVNLVEIIQINAKQFTNMIIKSALKTELIDGIGMENQ